MSSRLVVLAFVLVALAGCGGDDGSTVTDPGSDPSTTETTTEATPSASDSATASPSESATPKGPQCADMWVDEAKLPGGYQDCYDGDQRVKADGRYCEFGKKLITYDNRFWAVPAGPIHEVSGKLLDDVDYRDALMKCGG
ncbi:MAG: hypothetical protein ACR2JD_09475 [Nocardioides sp.]